MVSAYTNNGVKLQCLGQTLALFPHHSKVTEIACRWLQCWEVTQPCAFRDSSLSRRGAPHNPCKAAAPACVVPLPAAHQAPEAQKDSTGSSEDTKCLSSACLWCNPRECLVCFFFPKIPLSDLLPDLPAALYPPWQSLLNPLICLLPHK